MKQILLVFIICLLSLECFASGSIALDLSTLRFKDVKSDLGYLTNTGSDGYIIITNINLNHDQVCGLKFELEFLEPMVRPGLFEIFWRGTKGNFGEKNKAFFIINQKSSNVKTTYLLPLCKLVQYSGNITNQSVQSQIEGLRIDFPSNKIITVKFHSIVAVNSIDTGVYLKELDEELIILELYERVRARFFTSWDYVIPKLFFALQQGLRHLQKDFIFLVFWLAVILSLVFLIIYSWAKKTKQE